jgi:hypothetical protein
MHARVSEPATLESRLRMIGINVPDQSKIPHMMEATRLGFPPTISRVRLWCAWCRWLTNLNVMYEVYTFDNFTREYINSDGKTDRLAHSWGGMPTATVMSNVEKMRRHTPDVELFVHATFDDPWLEARRGNESIFIHCWMRPCGRSQDITLVI